MILIMIINHRPTYILNLVQHFNIDKYKINTNTIKIFEIDLIHLYLHHEHKQSYTYVSMNKDDNVRKYHTHF